MRKINYNIRINARIFANLLDMGAGFMIIFYQKSTSKRKALHINVYKAFLWLKIIKVEKQVYGLMIFHYNYKK